MEVLPVPSITKKVVCLARNIHEADFDAFSNKIQHDIDKAKYYADDQGKKDSDVSIKEVLNNIKNKLSVPSPVQSSHPSQLAVSWEMQRMRELQEQLPELAQFKLHRKIGSGTFSIVYLASLKANPRRLFALKHLVPTTLPHRIEHELKCLREIGGQDNVVGVDICLRNNDCIVFVMPYINQVRIHDFVKDIGVAETRGYMHGLLVALRRVHSFNIIHRDVKPSNFLYDRENKKYLLIDFGLASQAYQPPNDQTKPALECNNKRRRDDNLSQVECSNFANPPKRMALQTIENENDNRSPGLLTHSSQKTNQVENCPPTDTGKVDIRINEVKKRLFANDSNMLNTGLGQLNIHRNQKSSLKHKRSNKISIAPNWRKKTAPRNHIDRENLGTPEKKEELIGKEVFGPQVNDEAVTNKHGEFVAPKKNPDWVRKSMTPDESGKVLQTTKARKMLMPYKNSNLNFHKSSHNGMVNGFQMKEKLKSSRESNSSSSKNWGKLMTSKKGNEELVSLTKTNIEPSHRHQLLMEPKQHPTLMAPKDMVFIRGSNIPLDNRITINTLKGSGSLKASIAVGQNIEPSQVTTPLMAPKENLPSQNKRRDPNQDCTVSQTPRASGIHQFQTLTSCDKGGTSLRVQDSQVKEVRKETFVTPPNLTTSCSCFGKGRICELCVKRKSMVASRAGTPGFRPPEVLLKYSNQTTAVDLWAAGVIMLSLVSGCYPFFRSPSDIAALTELTTLFGSKKFQEVAKKLGRHVTVSQVKKPLNLRKLCEALRRRTNSPRPTEGATTCYDCRQVIDKIQGCICETDDDNLNPSQEPSDSVFPPSAYDLLRRLLDLNPETRITAAEALEHPFIKGE